MKIGKFDIIEKCFIVAEIGNNHEGDVSLACELIGRAAECGVDAVKFQTYRTDHYVNGADKHRADMLRKFELTYGDFEKLAGRAGELGLEFLSTPFDIASAEFLSTIVSALKISSSDLTFYPLLETCAETGLPLVLSTGLSNLQEIGRAVELLQARWKENGLSQQMALLHCIASYPAPPEETNLRALRTLRREFGCAIGYSDHTIGSTAAIMAIAQGARIIEKHFTLDHHYSDFRDHLLSAEPEEMKELVRSVRQAESMLGTGEKVPQPCEKPSLSLMRRSITAATDLAEGDLITFDNITWTRPAGGLPPGEESRIIHKRAARGIRRGEMITQENVGE
ncbi:N-acetylneuraminate synthase family protein [Fibrobacterota bacterium]